MREKNFVNFHIITSHSASNLNRDDMGLQKTAIFGGKKRIRISSQCEKRAIRTSDYYSESMKAPSIRTRELDSLLSTVKKELNSKYSDAVITEVVSIISGVKEIKEGTKAGAVAAWAISEIGEYCELYTSLKESATDDKEFEKLFKKAIKDKKVSFTENFSDGLDIALSGRMATSGIMTNVDAALAVAQVITTHTASNDIDWFTAVDDLSKDGGAAHLDSQEFGAGIFYKYASLNIKQLQQNLGDCSREKALEIAAHALHMLATTTPSGKQNSYAAFNFADFALVTIGYQPVSLANAFEVPVKPSREGGLLAPSIKEIVAYREKLFTKYSLDDEWACLNMCDGIENLEKEKESLNDLKEWLKNGGSDE